MINCSNCGTDYEEAREYCPACGAARPWAIDKPRLRTASLIAFFFVGLPLAGVGTCGLWAASNPPDLKNTGAPKEVFTTIPALVGIVCLVIAALLSWEAFLRK